MAKGGAGPGAGHALAAGDHVQTVPGPGYGHVEEADPVLFPLGTTGQPGGTTDPHAIAQVGLDGVEDDDGKFPSLEPVRGSDLSQRTAVAFQVTQRLQGGFGLGRVGSDYSGGLTFPLVQLNQGPGQQQTRGPPAAAAADPMDLGQVPEAISIDEHNFRIAFGMRPHPRTEFKEPVISQLIGQVHDVRAEPVLGAEDQTGSVVSGRSRSGDAAVPERVGKQPALDVRPFLTGQRRVHPRRKLHEIPQQHGTSRGFGDGQQHLGEGSRAHLIDQDDIVRALKNRLRRAEAGESGGNQARATEYLSLGVAGEAVVLLLQFGMPFFESSALLGGSVGNSRHPH